ncbi:hypothetical protein [Sediminicoccus sp. BL-A-41-H5]|uniref:hypothetical protein n=1 Tax=Sediminicoccus sp. BL-A-41-H5 TaxID=3421106 RepID=UPI003D67629B
MKLPHIAAAALLATLGAAQAQPASETPGMSRDAARPNMPPAPGTNTPAGVVQGTVPPMTGQGGQQGTVPIAPSPGVPPQGEARGTRQSAQSGLAPGDRARDAQGMGAGKPATSMPQGSVAGQAPGMGSTGAASGGTPGSMQPGLTGQGRMAPGSTGTPPSRSGATPGGTTPGTAPTR